MRQVHPKEVDQALVGEGHLATWCLTRDEGRDHIHKQRELPLAVVQGLLRGYHVVDVDAHAVPLDDLARIVAQRLRSALDPTMRAGGSALAISRLKGCARLNGTCERLIHCVPVIRMDERQGSRAIRRE